MRVPVLRGRSRELRAASTALEHAVDTGQGAIIVVSGEGGTGKTAFAECLLREARGRGFVAGSGKAEESDQIAPLAPLLVALRSGPAPLLSDEAFLALARYRSQQLWLVDRIADALEQLALTTPVVVHLDDVQWLDDLTVLALRVLPGRLAGQPVVWLLSTRPDPGGPADDVVGVPGHGCTVTHIGLGPLPAAAIEEMAGDWLHAGPDEELRSLLEGAAGNAFLATELLAGIAARSDPQEAPVGDPVGRAEAGLPANLVLHVRRRLRHWPEESLRLLQIGAVLGRTFPVDDAAALLGGPAASTVLPWLVPALRDGILADDGRRITFRHDLLRQAVYADVPASVRAALHRAAATHLLETGRSPVDAAPHLLVGAAVGDLGAVETLRAAVRTSGRLLPTAAAQLISHAFALLRQEDPPWAEVGLEAVAALTGAGRTQDALDTADVLLAAGPGPDLVAEAQVAAARALWDTGQLAAIRDRVESALALSGTAAHLRARLLAQRALAMTRDEPADARRAGRTALDAATATGDERARVTAQHALGESARNDGRNEEALGHFRELRSVPGSTYFADELLSLQLLDRYDEAQQLLTETARQLDERPSSTRLTAYHFARMWQHFSLGELDDAEADAETVLRLGDQLRRPTHSNEARILWSRICQLRGDYEGARAQLERASAPDGRDDEGRQFIQAHMRMHLAAATGDSDDALRTARGLLAPERFRRHRWFWQPLWFLEVTRVATDCGDVGLARGTADVARRLAERTSGVVTNAGVAALTHGVAHGNFPALREGAGLLRRSPRPLVRGIGAMELGRALLDRGYSEGALRALRDAIGVFTDMGALGLADSAQQLAARAGSRRSSGAGTSPPPVRGWQSLTPMEQRVARLIAAGHTNRSAATELALSPNTVATHLRSTFRKMDVNSRVQLTLAMRDAR